MPIETSRDEAVPMPRPRRENALGGVGIVEWAEYAGSGPRHAGVPKTGQPAEKFGHLRVQGADHRFEVISSATR